MIEDDGVRAWQGTWIPLLVRPCCVCFWWEKADSRADDPSVIVSAVEDKRTPDLDSEDPGLNTD